MTEERIIDKGWSVADDGSVFVIIAGSEYEIDATGSSLTKLPPGDYTDEEAEAALQELDEENKQASRALSLQRAWDWISSKF